MVSKGVGWVRFEEPASAAKCIDELQGKEYKTNKLYAGLRGAPKKKTEGEVGSRIQMGA